MSGYAGGQLVRTITPEAILLQREDAVKAYLTKLQSIEDDINAKLEALAELNSDLAKGEDRLAEVRNNFEMVAREKTAALDDIKAARDKFDRETAEIKEHLDETFNQREAVATDKENSALEAEARAKKEQGILDSKMLELKEAEKDFELITHGTEEGLAERESAAQDKEKAADARMDEANTQYALANAARDAADKRMVQAEQMLAEANAQIEVAESRIKYAQIAEDVKAEFVAEKIAVETLRKELEDFRTVLEDRENQVVNREIAASNKEGFLIQRERICQDIERANAVK